MKKALIALLVSCSLIAHAETPNDKVSMKKNITNRVSVTLLYVDNVNQSCDIESRSRGYGGFPSAKGKRMEGCSFWKIQPDGSNVCTIVVDENPTFWTLGHEFLHCLQGRFH
jgi:hypothetical protein